jgi:hypothetical protein
MQRGQRFQRPVQADQADVVRRPPVLGLVAVEEAGQQGGVPGQEGWGEEGLEPGGWEGETGKTMKSLPH